MDVATDISIYSVKVMAHLYGNLRVENSVVLDLGASIGDSIYYFLTRGASRIIAFEADPVRHARLQAYVQGDYRVEIHREYRGEIIMADVMKMDIEGSERDYLTEELLVSYPQWTVGLHPMFMKYERFLLLEEMLKRHGAYYLGGDGPFERVYSSNPPLP